MNSRPEAPTEAPPRLWSVKALLVALVLACLVPAVIGSVLLLVQEYRDGRAALEANVLQTTRALSQAVDHQILRAQSLAEGLAASVALADGDLSAFHRQARQTVRQAGLGEGAVLSDRSGRQIVNTVKEYGESLPMQGDPGLVRRVFETGGPVVSNLFAGAVLQRRIMTVAVPVQLRGEVAYSLNVAILPATFLAILQAQGLPPGWVATILDGNGTIVARSREHERFLGDKPAQDFLDRFLASQEGTATATMKDGTEVFSTFTQSPATGWRVAVSIPRDELAAQLNRHLAVMAIGVAALLAAGLSLAVVLGGWIARSFRNLAAPAAGPEPFAAALQVKEAALAARLLREREAALLASEGQYRVLFSNMAEGFGIGEVLYEDDGKPGDFRFLEANDAFYRETGIPRGILGRPAREYLPRVERSWVERYARVQATGESLRFEEHNADTGRYYEVGAFRPLPGRFAIVFRDITEFRRVELALQQSEASLRELIETLPGMVWTATSAGAVDFLSRRWYDYTGTTPETQLGEGTYDPIHPDDRGRVREAWQAALAEQAGYHTEFRLRRHDGRHRWFKVRGTPVRDGEGRVTRWLGVLTDIHDLKEKEAEVQRLNAELEVRVASRTAELVAANRELENFTFATSHDLKGPLGRINSFSALLKKNYQDRLEGDGLLFLEFISQNALRLTYLVDDLLNHARVAQQSLELQPIELEGLVNSVVREMSDDVRESGAELRLALSPGRVLADPHALGQALGNLLDNALKYSSQATQPIIEIGAIHADGIFRLWVKDNGIGFDVAYQDKIFEMFRRLHTYAEYPGSGVGLALVKRAMERMGGRVWAESAPGAGATFFLELKEAP